MVFSDPLFFIVAVIAVLVTGISKGGFGGIALFAVPLMALVVPPIQAAAIMLPVLLVMDVFSLWAWRGKWDRLNLGILLPGALLGSLIGWLFADYVNEDGVRLIVGLIAVFFTLFVWLKRPVHAASTAPSRAKGMLWGSIAGFASFIAHAGSPPFQAHMLPQKLDKEIYMGTGVVFFATANVLKIVPYTLLGLLSTGNLKTSLWLVPLAPIGVFLGVWLNRLIPQEPFYKLLYILTFLVGGKLIYDGATGLL